MKKVLAVILVVIVLGLAIGGFFIYRGISRANAMLDIALKDAGLTRAQIYDYDVEYEHGYYEVEFDSGMQEYFYRIDAKTGEILAGGRD